MTLSRRIKEIPVIVKIIKASSNIYEGFIRLQNVNFYFHLETNTPIETTERPCELELIKILYPLTIDVGNKTISLKTRDYKFFFNFIIPHAKKINENINQKVSLDPGLTIGRPFVLKKSHGIIESYYIKEILIPIGILDKIKENQNNPN